MSAHRSIVCIRKSSCYSCCTHRTSVFWKVSSYSSVSANGHRGGLTWSCFLVADCCAHSHAWLSLHMDKYCDSSCKSSSSYKHKESLSCGKLGVQWEIAISITVVHTVAAAHGNPICCKTAIYQPICRSYILGRVLNVADSLQCEV